MADNDKNNTSGDSRIPKSTQGLEGSVSLEDLKKYHLIKTNDAVSEDQTSNDETQPSADDSVKNDVENSPAPSVDHLQSEESNDHLSEAKQDNEPSTDKKDTKFVPTPPVMPNGNNNDNKKESSDTEENSEPVDKKDVKPWEKSFDSDTDDDGHVSRAVTKEKQRGNHTLVVTLVIALIVIMFTPVVINAVKGSGSGDLDSAQSSKSVENKDKSTKKKSTNKKSAKKKTTSDKKSAAKSNKTKKSTATTDNNNTDSNSNASDNADSNDTAANTTANNSDSQQASTSTDSSSQQSTQDQQASTDTNSNSTSTSDSSQNSGSSYYTVKAGDNWFRIAYNNNLTTAQLKSMNGNVGTLTPGTTLRVK